MFGRNAVSIILLFVFLVASLAVSALAQGKTTGRIIGSVSDEQDAVIAGAELSVVCKATGNGRQVITDSEGNYSVPSLPPNSKGRSDPRANAFRTASSNKSAASDNRPTPF